MRLSLRQIGEGCLVLIYIAKWRPEAIDRRQRNAVYEDVVGRTEEVNDTTGVFGQALQVVERAGRDGAGVAIAGVRRDQRAYRRQIGLHCLGEQAIDLRPKPLSPTWVERAGDGGVTDGEFAFDHRISPRRIVNCELSIVNCQWRSSTLLTNSISLTFCH